MSVPSTLPFPLHRCSVTLDKPDGCTSSLLSPPRPLSGRGIPSHPIPSPSPSPSLSPGQVLWPRLVVQIGTDANAKHTTVKTGRECDLGRERRAGGAGAGRRAVSGSSSSSISSKFMYDTVGRRRQTHSLSSCMSETHMPFPASRYGTASVLRSASQTPCTPSRRERMPYHLYDVSVFSGCIRRTVRAYWTCVRAYVRCGPSTGTIFPTGIKRPYPNYPA